MKTKIYKKDIEGLNNKEICEKYNISRISAWRLKSGRVDYIIIDYHRREICVDDFDYNKYQSIIRKMAITIGIRYSLKYLLDDIIQECFLRCLELAEKLNSIETIEGLNKYIYTICRYKCSEILKREKLKWWCNCEKIKKFI